jgi:Sec-independent protein translocase protein TatA
MVQRSAEEKKIPLRSFGLNNVWQSSTSGDCMLPIHDLPKGEPMRDLGWPKLIVAGLMVVFIFGCSDKSEEKTTIKKAVEQVKEESKTVTEKATEGAKEAVQTVKQGTKAVAEKTEAVANKAMEGAKKTVEAASEWTQDKMSEYVGKMGDQLNGFGDKFKDLAAKAEGLTGDAKDKFMAQLSALTEKKEAAAKEMEALKGASGDAWSAARERFEAAMKEIKVRYDKLIVEFAGN